MVVVPLDFSRQEARPTNRRMILAEIILNGPVARTEIARRTGLTAASVSRISRELIDAGLIVEGDEVAGERPGRRFVSLDVNATGGYVVGISMNVFQQSVTLADLKNRPIARRELGLTSFEDVDAVVAATIDATQDLLSEAGIPSNRIIGASVAVTGAVDPETGVICSAPLFGWEQVDIGKMLSEPLGIPVHVESLPNAINLAESRFGIGRGHNNVIVFNASLGVGVSMLIDNRLARGHQSAVGLIGKLSLWRGDDGNRLHVDDMAGGWSVLNALAQNRTEQNPQDAVPHTRNLLDVIERANDGDETARQALGKAGRALGEVIEVFNGIIHPELIVIAGPLAWCPYYIRGIRAAINDAAPGEIQRVPLEASDMTWRAATRWLAINEFLLQRDIDLETLSGRTVA